MNLRLRLAYEWCIITMLAAGILIAAHIWHSTDSFDNVIYDQFSALNHPKPDPNILLVSIDEPSLAVLGKWPWSRKIQAQMLEKLQAEKPRSITIDILLSEAGNPTDDAQLAAAMKGSAAGSAPVFIPLQFTSPGSNGAAYDQILPAQPFAQSARAMGNVNLTFDNDGIVRRAALCFDPENGGKPWPHLIELTYRASSANAAPSLAYMRQKCGDTLRIPYAKRASIASISFSDLLNNQLPTNMIRGKDIIIGATAAGMGDNYPVSTGDGTLMPGAEIMANMLGALRHDNFIKPISPDLQLLFSLLPVLLLMIGFLRWRPRTALILSLTLLVEILLVCFGLLYYQIWFAPGLALLGILLVYPLWGWRRLQAMSDFMADEVGALEREGELSALPIIANPATDLVGQQSASLAVAIDHVRDLRRFVSDTLAGLPDPMFVTDPKGIVTLTNRLLEDEILTSGVGQKIEHLLNQLVAHESRFTVDKYLDNALSSSSQVKEETAEFVRFFSPKGQCFVMRRAVIRSDQGAFRGHIHYLANISALAQAQTEREVVLQLLSHDMRAPQSAIIALLEGPIDDSARRRIERNARRTMQLAQDFVDMARMEEKEFRGEDILLADLVHEITDNLWPLAHERHISFKIIDNSTEAFVHAEPDSLSRALTNLVDNAIKYSPDNGIITINVTRENAATIDTPAMVCMTIADQGPGIAPGLLPLLFSRFASGGDVLNRVKGMGLGLNFVDAVIKRHGGSIKGENSAEGGSLFTLRLPQAADDESPAKI